MVKDLHMGTRKSSCGKPQQMYQPRHILSMACPARKGWVGGTPSLPGWGYPILCWLGGGVPHHDLHGGYPILTWPGCPPPGKGHSTSGNIIRWRWGTPPSSERVWDQWMRSIIIYKKDPLISFTRHTDTAP